MVNAEARWNDVRRVKLNVNEMVDTALLLTRRDESKCRISMGLAFEMWSQIAVVCARLRRTEIKGKHARENLAHVVTAVEQHLPLVLERAVARSREGQFAARLLNREWGGREEWDGQKNVT